ncbi:GHKL domain-containing protein [Niameybacter massiliensis]|uniref:GHKL domain-containing protein n=1 Tax=Holtiella tumoricola TaxID=3018743 RepID=A0AA42J1W2_9FIRM|nr:sensor histidine kinase [Holtiella tumoricola]MDA3732964.1 GHKL domain-containing protein [Holtiella tumoricola]
MTLYEGVYLCTNILGTYTLYKFMMIFFYNKDCNKRIEQLSYILYFLCSSFMYLVVKIPIIMLMTNIIAYFCLTLNYKAPLKKRTIAVAFIYLISMCIEIIVITMLSGIKFDIMAQNDYSLSYTLVVLALANYSIITCLSKFKRIKDGEKVQISYWVCLLLMPVASLYIILVLFKTYVISNIVMCIIIALLLLMNFGTFYLYDVISKMYSEEAEKKWIAQQNMYYEKQFNMMKSSVKTTRTIKHDLKNHLYMLRALVERDEKDNAIKHISEIMDVCELQQEYAQSGNIAIDSILNFKLQQAVEENIKVIAELYIPFELELSSFDMSVILGNLLDNAINAVNKIEEHKYIHVKIKYTKGVLIIKIENTFNGVIEKDGESILTTHQDKENHGIGLESIKRTLEKYDGSLEIEYAENVFSALALIYIN